MDQGEGVGAGGQGSEEDCGGDGWQKTRLDAEGGPGAQAVLAV